MVKITAMIRAKTPARLKVGLYALVIGAGALGITGCKTTSNRNAGAEFFAARDQAENPNAQSQQWRAKWLSENSFRFSSELPAVLEGESCEIMEIMIELPAISTEFEVGHTGVAIGAEYFDYGPVKSVEKSRARLRAEGGPYWDNPASWPGAQSTDDVSWQMIRDTIATLAGEHTVLVVPIVIEKSHADAMRLWWKKTYKDVPEYNIPGMHCTSSVIRGIEETDVIRGLEKNQVDRQRVLAASSVTSPLKYAQILLGNKAMNAGYITTKHTCGSLKGRSVKAAIIHAGPDLGKGGVSLVMQNSGES